MFIWFTLVYIGTFKQSIITKDLTLHTVAASLKVEIETFFRSSTVQ